MKLLRHRALLFFLFLLLAAASLLLLPLPLNTSDLFDKEEEEVVVVPPAPASPARSPPLEAPVRARVASGSASVAKEVLAKRRAKAIRKKRRACAMVEEMGAAFGDGYYATESLRVRSLIRRHFDSHGASNVRSLPSDQFCRQGFVLGKPSEAGFGNEMYKVLSAAVLSIMLNRSLIIGESRFRGTIDTIACQFFLKSIHPRMRTASSTLYGEMGAVQSKANIYGELMSLIISPSQVIEEAINWSLKGGANPDIAVHMRMMSSRSGRALHAALSCIKKSLHHYRSQIARPRVVLISDTPSFVKDMSSYLSKFAEVIHFKYRSFEGKLHGVGMNGQHQLAFRARDWGPAPRWVAIVDFFLASRARYAVISGANRRVGTTYVQLIAGLAAANQLGKGNTSFSFFSSFQSTLLASGLTRQAGWGHVWNRFAGPLSCRGQADQCAFTPLLSPAWWDGDWQSPISRDIRRLRDYGIQLTNTGQVVNSSLYSYCRSRKTKVRTLTFTPLCKNTKCKQ